MFNVGLADDHLYWKSLSTWLLLLMSFMVSYFVLSFIPRDVTGIELSQFLRLFLPTLAIESSLMLLYDIFSLGNWTVELKHHDSFTG